MVGTGDRRSGMALLSARRETSQTLKISSRTLERRIGQKTNSREKFETRKHTRSSREGGANSAGTIFRRG